jgi:hypothetical protein
LRDPEDLPPFFADHAGDHPDGRRHGCVEVLMTGPRSWTALDAATAPQSSATTSPKTTSPKAIPPNQRPRHETDADEPQPGDGPVDGWTDTDEFLAVEP